jgi:uncharacterized phiE125 gp8 family phage protein
MSYPTTLDCDRVQSPLKMEIVTQPALEPVTYEQLSDWCKLPSLDDRNLTIALATVGRIYLEQRTRRTFITTTFNLWMDYFPTTIILPARPVQTVSFVKYTDQNLEVQTLDTSRYLVDNKGPRPCIIPPLGSFFPIPRVQYPNAVQVQFVAGFGNSPSDVPLTYRQLITQWVATNYSQREAVVLGKSPAIVPYTFDSLLKLSSLPEV